MKTVAKLQAEMRHRWVGRATRNMPNQLRAYYRLRSFHFWKRTK